jgi:hypothetical protein
MFNRQSRFMRRDQYLKDMNVNVSDFEEWAISPVWHRLQFYDMRYYTFRNY